VSIVRREKSVTLGGREVLRPKCEEWVYEIPGFNYTYRNDDGTFESGYVTHGEFQEDGTFLAIPEFTEVPHYTSNTDDAFKFKYDILGEKSQLAVEEEFNDPAIPRWRAKLIAGSKIVSEGDTYDSGASIVLAFRYVLVFLRAS